MMVSTNNQRRDPAAEFGGGGRNWPFTFRVTQQERRLLRLAAIEQRTSVAEIVRRSGLDSLLSRLSNGHA